MSPGRAPARQLLALAAAASLAFLGPARWAQADETAPSDSARRGALTYRVYCQSCHGAEGRGDGPIAPDLEHPPPDLTLLAQRAGGKFPAREVRSKIDGREPVPSHGPSDMPVWGLTFALRGDADEEQVEERLDDLVALLRSWQRLVE